MNLKFFILFTLFTSSAFFSQNYADDDIFTQTKENYMMIKSSVDKNIRAKIKTIVQNKVDDLIKNPKDKYSKLSIEQVEFAKDTLTINEYLQEYNNYNATSTTFGMNVGLDFNNMEYDKLLNKYYKKDLEILQPAMKKQLINSQRKWLEYYSNETKFIYNLQNFGNHNYIIYASEYIDKMLIDRVLFLFDIYNGKMQGTSTYIEN